MGESKFKSLDEEFDFYVRFTKPFVLNKANSEDRARAATWIKKLILEEDRILRLDYLKLLLFALQKPMLIGPFKQLPPSVLEPLPKGLSIFEIISKVLEEGEREELHSSNEPIVSTAVSHDLAEYAAVQIIPNFGVQCFYATSPVSINQWHTSDEYIFPKRYCHGAEAWEQSLSQLYRSDVAGNFIAKNKDEKIITIDCCKDKPKCANNTEEDSKTDNEVKISDSNDEMAKSSDLVNRGPKSPWAFAQRNPCRHQPNQRVNFRWDKYSRLDSSYNTQPNSIPLEDYSLNDHGSTLFQTDRIAILLANKNVQKNKTKMKKSLEERKKN